MREEIEARRDVQVFGGYRLLVWFDEQRGGRAYMSYEMRWPDGKVLFSGNEYSPAPSNGVDSDDMLVELLAFLTLQPGDTDDEYFEKYTQEQLDWVKSINAEDIRMAIFDHEEEGCSDHYQRMEFQDWGV